MIRRFETAGPAFVLETPATTYAFRILPSGHPENLYYGPRITLERPEDLEPLIEKRIFPPGNTISYAPEHPAFVPEDTCLEVSAPGKGDLREPSLELVFADGSRTADFRFLRGETDGGRMPFAGLPGSCGGEGAREHLTLTLREASRPVTLELHYLVYPDCDCICRTARLINGGEEDVRAERLLSLQLDLPRSGYALTSFRGAWAREMERTAVPLTAGKQTVESRAGVSSSRANPFFMLHDPSATETAGTCYAFNLIYSGSHYAAAEVNAFGKTRVVSGIQPQGFSWLLKPGEALQAPEAVMTCTDAGFRGVSARMHAFVREHIVRGVWKDRPRPVLLNSWEACYFKISEPVLLSLARAGKELGIELFVMDDGWFGDRQDDTRALGDWDCDLRKLPGGLSGIADKITALGMRFGIWVEPEMVSVESELYRSHPDWAMEIPGRDHSEGRTQRLLDLSNPAVQDHLIEKMTEVFSSARISYVKWDMNRVFSDVFSPYLPPERQGETAHRYVLGLYRVLGTLMGRFPEILFEGCASGGNRFDLGMLCYFPQIWASDDTDALARTRIQEGYSYGYPLSTVSAHVSASPNHQTLRQTTLSTRFAVAAFGILGYELDLRDLGAEARQEIADQIALYKAWRDVLQRGSFYRGRSGNEHEWTCVSPDGRQAVGLLLRELARPNFQSWIFTPAGLDPKRRYRLCNVRRDVNVKRFGSLINTESPVHVRQGSLVHSVIARVMKMPGEQEDLTASGDTLMRAGVKLSQEFSGTGYAEGVRLFGDFASRLYFLEAEEDGAEGVPGDAVSGERE